MQSDGKVHARIYMFHNWILCRLTPLKIMKIAYVTIRLVRLGSLHLFSFANSMQCDAIYSVSIPYHVFVCVCVCRIFAWSALDFVTFAYVETTTSHKTSRPFRFLSSCTSMFMIFNYFIIHLKFSTENLLAYCLHSCWLKCAIEEKSVALCEHQFV